MGKKSIRALLGVAAVWMFAASCAAAPKAIPDEAETASIIDTAAILTAELALDPNEEDIFASGIADFLFHLARRYGNDFIDSLPRLRRPMDLNAFLSSNYETTTYREMIDAFMAWDRERKEEPWDQKTTERTETEHFALITMPGTAAHRERAFIARACEEYLESSEAFLRPDEASAERFQENLASLSGGKVTVVLPPNSRPFGRFNNTSTTNYGFTISGNRGLSVQVSIHLPYYNALSTAILAHEIVHVRDLMQKVDLSTAPKLAGADSTKAESKAKIDEFKAWAQGMFDKIVPNDRAFGEGIAEYAAARMNPLRRSFCLGPDDELDHTAPRIKLMSDILSQSVAVKDRRLRLVRYTELHSLVAYLIDTYGQERFLDFYLRIPPDEAGFIAAYGTDFAGMQTRWNEARR